MIYKWHWMSRAPFGVPDSQKTFSRTSEQERLVVCERLLDN